MQIDALIDVTEKDRYTNLMREDLLNILKQYKRNVLAALKEVDGNEDLAWKNIPYNQPILTLEEDDGGFYGGTRFALKLPFSEACKDDNFKKAYFDYGIILDLNVIYAKRLLDETEALMMLLKDYR